MSGVRVRGLGLRHDGKRVLSDISFDIRGGESLCLVGASGGGKSLIAAALAGLLPSCMLASGRVHLGGEQRLIADQAGLRGLWHRHICLLPQEPGRVLAPLLRADDQVGLDRPSLSRAAAVAHLAGFGLDRQAAHSLPSALSGGMAQRLLAAIMARSTAGLLVVDEPTKGLDPARRADIVAMLVALRGAGRALLVITHDLELVRGLGGALAVLEECGIAEAGPSEALLAAPASPFLRTCLDAEPARWTIGRGRGFGAAVAGAERLVIARGRRRLAGPLGLELRQGQVTALLGASGVGKTTLGDTLLGLEPAAEGHVRWLGVALDRKALQRFRPRFQKLHQDPTTVFPASRTFGEGFTDLGRLAGGREMAARVTALLERLRVSPDLLARRPGEVSGGEAQRLALARLLAVQPAFLVADEPASRLDMPAQAETFQLLRGIANDSGLAVLLITHDAAAAAAIADERLDLEALSPVKSREMAG